MVSNEGNAILADILERPEDDAPRLIYADWLEDNGHPKRAQFIRSQIQLYRLKEAMARYEERWVRAVARLEVERLKKIVDQLLLDHEADWLCDSLGTKSVQKPVHIYPVEAAWERGFIDSLYTYRSDWIQRIWPLCGWHPVRTVRLRDMRPDDRQCWYLCASDCFEPGCVPLELWFFFAERPGDSRMLLYSSLLEAEAAMSNACIRLARHKLAQAALGDGDLIIRKKGT